MKVITLINRKGGVAKTTTATFLFQYLISKGYKTLIIDLDSQGNLSQFNNVYDPKKNNVFNFLTDKEFIIKDNIISSNYNLSEIESEIDNNKLKYCINNKLKKYDFIIIDTAPNLSKLTISSLIASNYVIIPTQAEKGAYEGTKQTLSIINSLNKNIKVLGVLLTGYNERAILHKRYKELYEKLVNFYNTKIFNNSISKSIAIPEAQALGKQLLKDYANIKITKQYINFCKEIEEELTKKE